MVIAIFTTSRAEFGLLSNLVEAINVDQGLDFMLFSGGSHHLPSQGISNVEILKKKYNPILFDFLLNSDNEKSLTQSMGIELFQLSEIFHSHHFDFVLVAGDRIELLPIVQTAIVFRKPIIHVGGGEVTEGALDDQIRHMLTKSAHLHFCSSKYYQNNIYQMGEESWRIHKVGALGVDSIIKRVTTTRDSIFSKFALDVKKPTILLTYHPVTLEFNTSAEQQINNLFEALDSHKFQILITAPNIDSDHHYLFDRIQSEVENNEDCYFVRSLGITNYQLMLDHVEFVIGNSSSGILEVPYFNIPTVNIGDRQKGRIRHKSIIDTDYSVESINAGIKKALNPDFRESLVNMKYQFGDGHAAERIVEVLKTIEINEKLIRKKLEFPNA